MESPVIRTARHRVLHYGLGAATLIVTALGCSGDHATAPRPAAPVLSMTIAPTFIGPGETAIVAISVTPTKGDSIVDSWLLFDSATQKDSLALPFAGDDPQQVNADVTAPDAPVTATLLFTARVRTKSGATATVSGTLSVGDTTPPTARWIYVDTAVAAGQTASIGAAYNDNSGLSRIELHLTGALTRDDVYDEPNFPTDGSISYQVTVPNTPGDSIVQTAVATDMYGLRSTIRQVFRIKP